MKSFRYGVVSAVWLALGSPVALPIPDGRQACDPATLPGNQAQIVDSLLAKGLPREPGLVRQWLTLAAASPDARLLTCFKSRGFDLRLADDEGAEPIMWAAAHGTPATLDYLVSQGVPLTVRDKLGRDLAAYALGSANFATLDYLLRQRAPIAQEAIFAALASAPQIWGELRKPAYAGLFDLLQRDHDGHTLLHRALLEPRIDHALVLFGMGLSSDLTNADGLTAAQMINGLLEEQIEAEWPQWAKVPDDAQGIERKLLRLQALSLAPRAKVSQIKANMHKLQTLVETFGVNAGGLYPASLAQLIREAQRAQPPYWHKLFNPFNRLSGPEATLLDQASYVAGARHRGKLVYAPVKNAAGEVRGYRIYGLDKDGRFLQMQGQPFSLSDSPD